MAIGNSSSKTDYKVVLFHLIEYSTIRKKRRGFLASFKFVAENMCNGMH